MASRVSVSAWVKREVLSFSSFFRCFTRLPSCTVAKITSGLNSRISSASFQCIQIRMPAVPQSVSSATRKRLRVSPTNLSRVSRSVTRCALTEPPPRVSYSPRAMRFRRSIRRRRMRYTTSLDSRANSLACSTLNTSAQLRSTRVTSSIRPMYPAGLCQPSGSQWFITCRAASPLPSSTSSTSSGSSSGIGTLQAVASTATRLANSRALR